MERAHLGANFFSVLAQQTFRPPNRGNYGARRIRSRRATRGRALAPIPARERCLIEKRIFEARHFTGWRRMRALVALGRTRAPEGISALAEALRDSDLEIRLAALRGLGRTASPQAAEEILIWLGEKGLVVPALPLQSALIQCCAERPQLLLPYVQNAKGALREALGRVLGEVATPSLGMDLLQFVVDDLDELRAAAARVLAHTHSGVSF